MRPPVLLIAVISWSLAAASCAGTRPTNLGVGTGRLAPCPASPNCISSDDADTDHWASPLVFDGDPATAWSAARTAVLSLPRTEIVSETEGYLHAECRSAVFGFVDDLELHLRLEGGIIAVRSASRLGYSDWGVNRHRVEELRATLTRQAVIRQAVGD